VCCLYKIMLQTNSGKFLCKAERGQVRMGRGEGKRGRGGALKALVMYLTLLRLHIIKDR